MMCCCEPQMRLQEREKTGFKEILLETHAAGDD